MIDQGFIDSDWIVVGEPSGGTVPNNVFASDGQYNRQVSPSGTFGLCQVTFNVLSAPVTARLSGAIDFVQAEPGVGGPAQLIWTDSLESPSTLRTDNLPVGHGPFSFSDSFDYIFQATGFHTLALGYFVPTTGLGVDTIYGSRLSVQLG